MSASCPAMCPSESPSLESMSSVDRLRPVHVDIAISAPGAFCYFVEYDGPSGQRVQSRKGYFNVDPVITLPQRTAFFPEHEPSADPLHNVSAGTVLDKPAYLGLDGLIIISVLAKWMGKTPDWEKHFAEASRRGYNMLHWAPLQERGESGSPYSIYDQLRFDPTILKGASAKDGGVAEIREALTLAKEKYGLGGVTDVVLNHTANNSVWLHEHPEAGQPVRLRPH